jgi:hypothetical protein
MSVAVGGLLEGDGFVLACERAFGFASFDQDFGCFASESCLDTEAVFLARPLQVSFFPSFLKIERGFLAFFSTVPLSDVSAAGESLSRSSLMFRCFSMDGLPGCSEESDHLPSFFEGVDSFFSLATRDGSGDSPLFSPLSVSGDERSLLVFGLPL